MCALVLHPTGALASARDPRQRSTVRDRLLEAPAGPVRVVHRGTHAVYSTWADGASGSSTSTPPRCRAHSAPAQATCAALGAGPAYLEAACCTSPESRW